MRAKNAENYTFFNISKYSILGQSTVVMNLDILNGLIHFKCKI